MEWLFADLGYSADIVDYNLASDTFIDAWSRDLRVQVASCTRDDNDHSAGFLAVLTTPLTSNKGGKSRVCKYQATAFALDNCCDLSIC